MHSEDKAGKDVGEIIGTEPLGVTATNSIDDILAIDADAVIYSPLMANPDEVAALLRSGKNVVTLAVDTGLKYLSTELFS